MEKRPVVYKRRPKKSSSVLPAAASDTLDDPPGPGDIAKNEVAPDPKKGRKSWVDRSLSNRGRRSSISSGEEFNLSAMAFKWVETLFERRDGSKGNGVLRDVSNEAIKKPSVVNRRPKVQPPVEFVKEKQAMFIEIDAFELESEEESPASKPKPREWFQDCVDDSLDQFPGKGTLEIVPEDEHEEFTDCLSAALRTPEPPCIYEQSREIRLQSDVSLSFARNLLLDSEEFSSPRLSIATSKPSTESLPSNSDGVSDEEARRDSCDGELDNLPPLSCDSLISGLQSLQIGLQSLNTLAEEEEIDDELEGRLDHESPGKDLFKESGEILLETRAENLLPIFEALLEECCQTKPLSLREAIFDFCDLSEIQKLGEGTFGEAFKGVGSVFKIVPMDGEFLVNGEVQKTSAEMYSEVLLTNTLNRLRGVEFQKTTKPANSCSNFIETKAIRVCQGSYEAELCLAWEQWDASHTSENDHPMLFPLHQLYVVFVLADGGKDLETFVIADFGEARSLLLQVVLALGVAEEGCGFEHRDLHWGNIVLKRDPQHQYGYYRLLNEDLKIKTFGLSVSIIDFTLSRINTGKHVFFCNLSADPVLFEGSGDVQSETYRRMLKLTKENWEGSFPQTNCYWIHYVADILLNKKSIHCSSQEKRALRSFRKRVLLYESAKATVSDDFFHDLWITNSERVD